MNEVKLLNIGGVDQNIKDQYARDVIAPSENGLDSSTNLPVSSRHYDVGEYLIGQTRAYYEVIAEINVGDTIVVGTNVRATTVSDEIIALKNQSASAAIETIADTETTGLASQPYTKGSYFYWDYGLTKGLYKVINADISQGDAFVSGVNIQYTQVGNELLILKQNVESNSKNILERGSVNELKSPSPTSYSTSGVRVTINDDGTILLNGKSTAVIGITLMENLHFDSDTYKLSGVLNGGAETFRLDIRNANHTPVLIDTGSGVVGNLSSSETYYSAIRIGSGVQLNDVVIKPMVTKSYIENSDYDHYVPYAMSNRDLTTEVANKTIGRAVIGAFSNVYVTGDGTKTYGQLLNELFDKLVTRAGQLPSDGSYLAPEFITVQSFVDLDYVACPFKFTPTSNRSFYATSIITTANQVQIRSALISSSGSTFRIWNGSIGGTQNTISDLTNNVVTNGVRISAYYQIYTKV